MKQLLTEALEVLKSYDAEEFGTGQDVMGRLRAAIDAPEQEPVAWTLASELGFLDKSDRCSAQMFSFTEPDQEFIPLYTRPQPVADLTDEEIHLAWARVDYAVTHEQFKIGVARAVLEAQKAKS